MRLTLRKLLAGVVTAAMLLSASIASAASTRPDRAPTPSKSVGAKKAAKLQSRLTSSVPDLKPTANRTPDASEVKTLARSRAQASRPAEYRPDHLIVKWKTGQKAADIDALRSSIQATTVRRFKTGAELLRLPKGSNLTQQQQILLRSGRVEYAVPDRKVYASDFTPNDTYFGQMWGLKNTGQAVMGTPGTPGVDINAPGAWEINQGDPSVIVAVIDTGIDFNHPDLAGVQWVNPGEIPGNDLDDDGNGMVDDVNGWDFWNWDGSVFDPADGDDHGTHVAGTIAAHLNNGLGVAGVAPNVKIMSLKFLGPQGGYTSDAIYALEYAAAHGARVANNSWGGGGYDPALEAAIRDSGILFVAAAGNDSADNDMEAHYPASYNLPNVLAVAAVTNTGDLAYFSNYGANSVHVGAPGHRILSTVPKRPATGAAIQNEIGTGKTMFSGFGIHELDPADAADMVAKTMAYFGVSSADPIAVILDDEADRSLPDMGPAMTSLFAGYNATFIRVPSGTDAPPLSTADYKAVIWTTGEAYGEGDPNIVNLTANDQENLENYLSSGGRLWLMGADAIWNNEDSSFVTDTLGVHWLNEGENRPDLSGDAGAAYDGMIYSFAVSAPFRDQVEPNGPTAKQALTYAPFDTGYDLAYDYYSGTSMATPHVTGVAALLMSKFPTMTAVQVKDLIMKTVTPLPSLASKTKSGGMVNALNALSWDPDNDVPGVPFPAWGATVEGTLAAGSDWDDVYSVDLVAGQKVKIWMNGDAGTDFDLYLFGPGTPTVNDVSYIVAGSEGLDSTEYIEINAPVSGTYYIDAFGYSGAGKYTLRAEWGFGPGCYEEDNTALTFTGAWTSTSNPYASGGAYKVTATAGASAEFKFYGDEVRLFATKSPIMGMARVTLDGVSKEVDLYSGTTQYNQEVFYKNGLARGVEHTVKVEALGKRSPYGKKTAVSVSVDQICVALDTTAPAPVTALHAYPYDGYVEVEWPYASNPDAKGFVVYRATTPGGPFSRLTETPIPVSDPASPDALAKHGITPSDMSGEMWYVFTDETVENGTGYYYVVRSVDQYGNESTDSPAAFAHPDDAPATPAANYMNLDGAVRLYWAPNPESDVAEYVIKRLEFGSGMPPLIFAVTHNPSATVIEFLDTTVTNETEYGYEIYAVDEWGVRSNTPAHVVGHPSAAPATPANFEGMADGSGVTLTWDPISDPDAKDYLVERYDSAAGKWVKVGATMNTSIFDPFAIPPGSSADYRLFARDTWGVLSAPAMTTVSSGLTPPEPPTGLMATAGDGQVSLSWTASASNVAGYNIYRSTTSGSGFVKVNANLVSGTSYTDSGLTNNVTYYYFVTAVSPMGLESTPSNEASAMPRDMTPPAVPTGVVAIAGDSTASVLWNGVSDSDLAGYNVYRSTTAGVKGTLVATVGASVNDFHNTGLTNGVTYYYSVTSFDTSGNESAPSAQASATPTDLTPPSAPTNVTASAGNGQVTLSWTASTDNTGVTGYQIYYGTGSTRPTTWTLLATVTGTSHTATGLTNGSTYWFVVKARDAAGNLSGESNAPYAMPNISEGGAGTYENNNTAVKYTTTWPTASSGSFSGGSIAYSNNAGAEAKLVFTGTGVEYIAFKNPSYGLVRVYIDGVEITTVDLYSATNTYKATVFSVSGLTLGVHEIRIVRTGTKNPSATNYQVNLDAFKVQ